MTETERPPTRVVNVRFERCTLYVGRARRSRGYTASRWANPFKIGTPGVPDALTAVALYDAWLLTQPDLLADIPSLRGLVLGCWCRPPDGFQHRLCCHGQVLAGRADGIRPEDVD